MGARGRHPSADHDVCGKWRGGYGLEGAVVAVQPVELEPEEGGGPGPGDLEDADQDQQTAADPGDELGVSPGELERGHPALEGQGHDDERDAHAEAVDEG